MRWQGIELLNLNKALKMKKEIKVQDLHVSPDIADALVIGCADSIEKIVIDKMRDVIIVEKSNGNDILKGSKLFCGCCGKSLGELSKKITFPFSSVELNKLVKNKTYETMLFGLNHKVCGHTMFSFRKEYGFITLENYLKEVIRVKKHSL